MIEGSFYCYVPRYVGRSWLSAAHLQMRGVHVPCTGLQVPHRSWVAAHSQPQQEARSQALERRHIQVRGTRPGQCLPEPSSTPTNTLLLLCSWDDGSALIDPEDDIEAGNGSVPSTQSFIYPGGGVTVSTFPCFPLAPQHPHLTPTPPAATPPLPPGQAGPAGGGRGPIPREALCVQRPG